jgi:hypothetical protein
VETWEQVGTVSFVSGDVVPHEGASQIECYWDYDDQDEWMITPEFVADGTTMLTFWTYITYGSTYGDHYYLKVSTDGGTTWDVVWDASEEPAGENHYDEAVEVNLGAYAGENIKLAWQGYAIDGLWYAWFLDDITVETADGVYAFNGTTLERKAPVIANVSEQSQLSRSGDVTVSANDRAMIGYNVYRNDGVLANTANTFYIDNTLVGGDYDYYVTAVYSGDFESAPSDHFLVEGISTSDVSEDAISVYPNPAKEMVNITVSDNVESLRVLNYVGQVVYEQGITSEKLVQVSTDRFEEGAYIVQFTTNDGELISKRFVVLK